MTPYGISFELATSPIFAILTQHHASRTVTAGSHHHHWLGTTMNSFDFDIFLTPPEDPSVFGADEFLDMVEEQLFEAFQGDVTPGMSGGYPVLACTISAGSIDDAVKRVNSKIEELGLHPYQLLMRLQNDSHEGNGLRRYAY